VRGARGGGAGRKGSRRCMGGGIEGMGSRTPKMMVGEVGDNYATWPNILLSKKPCGGSQQSTGRYGI